MRFGSSELSWGVPVNVNEHIVTALNNGPGSGVVVTSLVGTTAEFSGARQILLDNLHKTGPCNTTTFLYAIELDLEGSLRLFKGQEITKYFINGFDFFAEPAFAHAFLDNAVAGRADTPNIPLYIYHAVKDEISPIKAMDD